MEKTYTFEVSIHTSVIFEEYYTTFYSMTQKGMAASLEKLCKEYLLKNPDIDFVELFATDADADENAYSPAEVSVSIKRNEDGSLNSPRVTIY